MKTRINLDSFLKVLITFLISFSLLNELLTSLKISNGLPFSIAISFFFTLSAIFLVINYYNLVYFSYLLVFIIFSLVSVSLITGSFKSSLHSFAGFFIWCFDYINGYSNIISGYRLTLEIILAIFTSFFCALFIYRYFLFPLVLAVGCGMYSIMWILECPSSMISFYIFSISILVFYLKYIQYKKQSSKNNEYAQPSYFNVWIFFICLIVFILAYKIPASTMPIQWPWLDRKINSFFGYNYYSSFTFFSFNSTAYKEDDTSLGGYLSPDDTFVLEVDSPRYTYLKGACHDLYNGQSWTSTDKSITSISDPENKINADIFEMKKGMQFLTDETDYLTKYFYKDKIKVTFKNLSTKSMFYPIKTEKIEFPSKDSSYAFVYPDGSLFSKKRLEKNFYYQIEVYSIKNNDDAFKALMAKSRKGLYKQSNLRPQGISDDDLEKLIQYSNEAYSKYVQLPQSLPQRVRALAQKIASGASSDYEKVKAIETYLSTNYSYTLTPKEIPKGHDFVDYFLFESKNGYCTYYATAMTILTRCLGIPARYVEGYILPTAPQSGSIYHVTNKNAHAWVEVYFEGFGWLPFEPSSTFTANFYKGLKSPAANEQSVAAAANALPYIDNMLEEEEEEQPVIDFNVRKNTDFKKYIVLTVVIIIMIAPFLMVVSLNSRKYKYRLQQATILPPRESILIMYKHYLDLLTYLGFPKSPDETAIQYAQRLKDINELKPLDIEKITEIFIKARYGLGEINYKEKRIVYDCYNILINMIKKDLGKYKFYAYRYLFGWL